MNSTEQRRTSGSLSTGYPPLRQFPPLRQPRPETTDRGTVRLGESCITAKFPPRR